MKVISLRTKRPVLHGSMDVVDDRKIERVDGGFTISVARKRNESQACFVFVPDSNVIDALCEEELPAEKAPASLLQAWAENQKKSEPQPAKKPGRRRKK